MEAAKLDDPGMRKDLVRIIAQYLEEQGFVSVITGHTLTSLAGGVMS